MLEPGRIVPQARNMAVKNCIHEFQRLADPAHARDVPGIDAPRSIAAFRETLEALTRVGCEIEAQFVRQLRDRLLQVDSLLEAAKLTAYFEAAIAHLDAVPWLPEALRDRASGAQRGPLRLYFVRHAESTGNQERRLQGSRLHGALTPRGCLQSKHTAEYLFDTFADLRAGGISMVSSPIGRALETARPIAERFGCALSTEPELGELDFGDWSGQLFADLEGDSGYREWIQDQWFHSPPAGESLFEVRSRMCQAVASLLSRAIAGDTSPIIVTHFFPLMAIFDTLMPGEIIRPDNSSINCVEYKPGRWRPILVNYTAHLGDDGPTPVGYV